MKKARYKMTTEVYKEIKKLAYALPDVPKFDKHGKPVYQVNGVRVKGRDLPAGTKVDGQDIDPSKTYISRKPKMVLQNHEVALIESYEQFGMTGIKEYCKSVENWIEKFNAEQKARKEALTQKKQKA